MKRVHVVGAPRSGTTLMLELLINGFVVDGFASEEQSVFALDRFDYDVFFSKNPRDVPAAGVLLDKDPDQWFIFMLRDPRDVVVSKHNRAPGRYWANLMQWRRALSEAAPFLGHARFLTIRYETLVANPDSVQERLMTLMPFLELKVAFSVFHKISAPSHQSLQAMRGLRPVSARSIGSWRHHKPRLAGQIKLHGDISKELIHLGYESDSDWLDELIGIVPDTQPGFWPDSLSETQARSRHASIWKMAARYLSSRGFIQELSPAADLTDDFLTPN